MGRSLIQKELILEAGVLYFFKTGILIALKCMHTATDSMNIFQNLNYPGAINDQLG